MMAVARDERGTRRSLSTWLPIVDWLPRYQRDALRGDLIAGVAVTALVVRKKLGGVVVVDCREAVFAAVATHRQHGAEADERKRRRDRSGGERRAAGTSACASARRRGHARRLERWERVREPTPDSW